MFAFLRRVFKLFSFPENWIEKFFNFFLREEASFIPSRRNESSRDTINNDFISSANESSINKHSLSRPIDKPIAFVSLPPIILDKESYLPPPQIVSWEPIELDFHSKTKSL